MRIKRSLSAEQDTIRRFLAVLGGGSIALSNKLHATPGFFISAYNFIRGYIEDGFFRKEELLVKALEEVGFSEDSGPVEAIHAEQAKSRVAGANLLDSAERWQAGDENARAEVGWNASEYSLIVRQHLDRLKNLIFPLLEQNLSRDDEHAMGDRLNSISIDEPLDDNTDTFLHLVETLEEELADWD
jgi:hemerythrin-like domain-containing protein